MFNKKLKQENSRLTQELLDIKQELEKCKMQLVVEEDNFDKSQQIISELKKDLSNNNICLNCKHYLGGGDWGLSCGKDYYKLVNALDKSCDEIERR